MTLCVESLFANCNDKKDVEVLNKLVNVVAVRSAFSDICLRLDSMFLLCSSFNVEDISCIKHPIVGKFP